MTSTGNAKPPKRRSTPAGRRYAKGRRYEYKVKKQLEVEGWTVLRTAGSHGDADLICYKKAHRIGRIGDEFFQASDVMFIQVKVSPTKADRDKIEALRRETGLDWRLM